MTWIGLDRSPIQLPEIVIGNFDGWPEVPKKT